MELVLNQFIGYNLKAPDGYVGKVCDFYFDDRSWQISYLVVDTGNWLGREIVISPMALLQPDVPSRTFPIRITLTQIQSSPVVPLSNCCLRKELSEVSEYFGWSPDAEQRYPEFLGSTGKSRLSLLSAVSAGDDDRPDQYFPRLRRTQSVSGFEIRESAALVGRVSDYIIDDTNWQIIYLVIKVERSISHKHLLMDSRHLYNVYWSNDIIELNL